MIGDFLSRAVLVPLMVPGGTTAPPFYVPSERPIIKQVPRPSMGRRLYIYLEEFWLIFYGKCIRQV